MDFNDTVVAVPPLARNFDYTPKFAANYILLKHIEAGGIRHVLWREFEQGLKLSRKAWSAGNAIEEDEPICKIERFRSHRCQSWATTELCSRPWQMRILKTLWITSQWTALSCISLVEELQERATKTLSVVPKGVLGVGRQGSFPLGTMLLIMKSIKSSKPLLCT